MLTPEEKNEIKKLLIKSSAFRVAAITGHSPKTVRKVRDKMYEEMKDSGTDKSTEGPGDFVIIPIDAGFLAELVVENVINPDSEVFLPVSHEIAEEFFKIEKAFKGLEQVSGKIVEDITEGIDKNRKQSESG